VCAVGPIRVDDTGSCSVGGEEERGVRFDRVAVIAGIMSPIARLCAAPPACKTIPRTRSDAGDVICHAAPCASQNVAFTARILLYASNAARWREAYATLRWSPYVAL
jgi:hypothetical protein